MFYDYCPPEWFGLFKRSFRYGVAVWTMLYCSIEFGKLHRHHHHRRRHDSRFFSNKICCIYAVLWQQLSPNPRKKS